MGFLGFGANVGDAYGAIEQATKRVNKIMPSTRQKGLSQQISPLISPLWIGHERLGPTRKRYDLLSRAITGTIAWYVVTYSRREFDLSRDGACSLSLDLSTLEFGSYLSEPALRKWAVRSIMQDREEIVGSLVDAAELTGDKMTGKAGDADGIANYLRFVGGLCAFGTLEEAKSSLLMPDMYLFQVRQ